MRLAFTYLLAAAALHAQLGLVYNAADDEIYPRYRGTSRNPALLPATLAPGSLAVIRDFRLDYSGDIDAVLPPGTSVSLRGFGQNAILPAQVLAAKGTEIQFIVPPNSPRGAVQVIFRAQGDITRWISAVIVPADFMLFRSGWDAPVAQRIGPDGVPQAIGLATPGAPGQSLVLWGVGLGETAQSEITATLGDIPQKVLFAGPSPTNPGVDQLNLRIHPATPTGCYVPLVISFGSKKSYNPKNVVATLSVSRDGKACDHPAGLSAEALQLLDYGAVQSVATLSVASDLVIAARNHASRAERLSLMPYFASPYILQRLTQGTSFSSGCTYKPAEYMGFPDGFSTLGQGLPPGSPPILASNGLNSVLLQVSPTLGSYVAALPDPRDSPLASLPAPRLVGGDWEFSSPAWFFKGPTPLFRLTLPRPLQLIGPIPATFKRTLDQAVSWPGSDYRTDDVAVLSLTGFTVPFFTPDTIICSASANTGTITLPTSLLSQMQPGAATLNVKIAPRTPRALKFPSDTGFGIISQVLFTGISTSDTRPADIQ